MSWKKKEKYASFVNFIGGVSEEDLLELFAGAFDASFYLRQLPAEEQVVEDLLAHFLTNGWLDGLDPSRDFSTDLYLNANKDVASKAVNPLAHFLLVGQSEGRKAHSSEKQGFHLDEEFAEKVSKFDRNDIAAIVDDFDADFYRGNCTAEVSASIHPLLHYLVEGWMLGSDPTPEFSTAGYMGANKDVVASGMHPYIHYVRYGREEGRKFLIPSLSDPSEAKLSSDTSSAQEAEVATGETDGEIRSALPPELEVMADHFDAGFYRTNHDVPDGDAYDLLRHFAEEGWKLGYDPSEEFSVSHYLETYPDIKNANINPFWHYVVAGKTEGRSPKPVETEDVSVVADARGNIQDIKEWFDDRYYLATYGDVRDAGADPLEHFWETGWKEGRNPNSQFSTKYYCDTYPDIVAAGLNPFWHYIVSGKAEGRQCRHPGGYKAEVLAELKPLEEEEKDWVEHSPYVELADKLLSANEIVSKLSFGPSGDKKKVLISISHDNYMRHSGGIQICINREEELSSKYGYSYLVLFPIYPLPRLASAPADELTVGLVLNNEVIGACRYSDLETALSALKKSSGKEFSFVLHQLLGHSPEAIKRLLSASECKKVFVWLHDYFLICPSFTLQRNSISYCGAPSLTSNACGVCKYGAERKSHLERFGNLFEGVEAVLLSPSDAALAVFDAGSELKHKSVVVPHIELKTDTNSTIEQERSSDVIKVGFVGTIANHKGWPVFEQIVSRYGNSPKFQFYYFGVADVPVKNVTKRNVHVTAETPTAMIDELVSCDIDFVVHWASWPETFSFTAFESFAMGASVLTNRLSGNVAAAVEKMDAGLIFDEEAELLDFFESELLEESVKEARNRKQNYSREYHMSEMVFEVLN